jgi:hypothetical protein
MFFADVEPSSLSTQFDPTLNSVGSWEMSGLRSLLPGEQPGPLWLPISRHSVTASSNSGAPLQSVVHPRSSRPCYGLKELGFDKSHSLRYAR